MRKIFIKIAIIVIFIFLLGCGNNIEKPPTGGTNLSIANGNEIAKILLANERLDQNILEDTNKIFVSGKEAFSNILKATQLSTSKLSKREGETYTEVDGNTYKWYNDVDYSNFISYFESYVENIEFAAKKAVVMIEDTKKYIRVVNTWVKIGNEETLLIVNENSEIILTRYDDVHINICKRYTDENGKSVYEMVYTYDNYVIRMKYIPGLVYEFANCGLDKNSDPSLYLLADNSKGYWTVFSSNGLSSFTRDGIVNKSYNMQILVMKDEATYMFEYMKSNQGEEYVGDIQVVSSDGKSDLISFSQNNITLFNTGVYGLDHLEITASKDKVGDFDPNSPLNYYVYEQNNIDDQGQKYKIYSTSGLKSATAVCENGLTFTEGDELLGGKVTVGRVDVFYVAGCESYGIIPFRTMANSLEEQFEILKQLLDYTGLTFRRDYNEVIACIEYSIKDVKNFPKYYTINGYHVNDFEQLHNGINIEAEEYKNLLNIYEKVKDIEVVNIDNQSEYNENIYFTDLEVINQGTINNEDFTITVEKFEIKVEDTLLFVEGQEYQIALGLLTVDNNIIPFINKEDSKFVYKKEESFILSLNKNIEIPTLTDGEYILAAFVSLAGENIRTSNFIPVYGKISETTKTLNGYKNIIKNDSEGRIIIISAIDYNVYYNTKEDVTFDQLQEMLAKLAYDHGMFEEIIVEKFIDNNWIIYEQKTEEKDNEDGYSDSSVPDNEATVNSNNDNVEKGQYRMKYIANTTEDNIEDYYIYITIE